MTTTYPAEQEAATEPRAAHGFRPDIQGLRAIAVILVVLSHVGVAGFSGGYVGVDIFFVISGYLITGLLLREAETRRHVSITAFYARRVRRILPAATAVLLTVIVVIKPLLGIVAARPIFTDGAWTALFAANFRFMTQGTDYFASKLPPSPLQHYWSLAVEEQFYVVWPLIIMFAAWLFHSRLRRGLILVMTIVVSASLAWSILQTADSQTVAYFSPLTRAWELGAGALLATCATEVARLSEEFRRILGWAGMTMIVAATLAYNAQTPFPGYTAMLPVLGAVSVIAAGSGPASERDVTGLLSTTPLQWIGLWSYSWYLWHWPILVIADRIGDHPANTFTRLLLALFALLLAALTYVAIEQPFRSAPFLRFPRPALVFGVLTVIFSLLLSSMLSTLHRAQISPAAAISTAKTYPGWVDQTLTAKTLQALARQATIDPILTSSAKKHIDVAATDGGESTMGEANCLLSNTESWTPAPDQCIYGDVNSKGKTIALWGDSHAAMWEPALDLLGRIEGFRVIVYSRGSCPVPTVHAWDAIANKPFTLCDTYRRQVISELQRTRPDVIVMASNHEPLDVNGAPQLAGYEDEWAAGMTRTLDAIKPIGAQQLILGDLPRLADSAPECLSKNVSHPGQCNTPFFEAQIPTGHEDAERIPAKKAGVSYISMTPLLCTRSKCPAVIGNAVVYQDRFHLTGKFVISVSPLLSQWITNAKKGKA